MNSYKKGNVFWPRIFSVLGNLSDHSVNDSEDKQQCQVHLPELHQSIGLCRSFSETCHKCSSCQFFRPSSLTGNDNTYNKSHQSALNFHHNITELYTKIKQIKNSDHGCYLFITPFGKTFFCSILTV